MGGNFNGVPIMWEFKQSKEGYQDLDIEERGGQAEAGLQPV
jgi:hypothetical protein